MSGSCEREKSQFWDYALTVNLHDVVYIHCHQHGKITLERNNLWIFPLSQKVYYFVNVFSSYEETPNALHLYPFSTPAPPTYPVFTSLRLMSL